MKENLTKSLHDFDSSIKSEGIACINSNKGKVITEYGLTRASHVIVKSALDDNGFEGLNSQFNSIFYDRGFPELISVKNKKDSRYIKFLDRDLLVFAIVDNKSVNYSKIKSHLDKISIE